MPRTPKTLEERLLTRLTPGDPADCWVWQGRTLNGYGLMQHHFPDGRRNVRVHRTAYELWVGPIPEGLTIDHLCRNRLCCNPAHLDLVPLAENVKRGGNSLKVSCSRGHPFDEANTYRRKDRPGRVCKVCTRERVAALRLRRGYHG